MATMANLWVIFFVAIFLFNSYINILKCNSIKENVMLSKDQKIHQHLYGHGDLIIKDQPWSSNLHLLISPYSFLVPVLIINMTWTKLFKGNSKPKCKKRMKGKTDKPNLMCKMMMMLMVLEIFVLMKMMKIICRIVTNLCILCCLTTRVTVITTAIATASACFLAVPSLVLGGGETDSGQAASFSQRQTKTSSNVKQSIQKRLFSGEYIYFHNVTYSNTLLS